MNLYEYVRDLDVPINETMRINCPMCNGIKTFTITNSMGTRLWNCYKASCDAKGKARMHMSMEDMRKIVDSRNGVSRKQEVFELPEYIVPYDRNLQGNKIHYKENYAYFYSSCMYDVKENRAVFRVYNTAGVLVDAVGKALNKYQIPKWKRYGSSKVPYFIALQTDGTIITDPRKVSDVCVVVEDCLSAVACAKHNVPAVALLGTNLLEEYKQYLSVFKKVIVALDPDALPKTMIMAKELRGWVDNVKILSIIDDLKYENETDINKLKEMAWN